MKVLILPIRRVKSIKQTLLVVPLVLGKETQLMVAPPQTNVQRKVFGRPGYRVTKVCGRDTGKEGMMVQVHLPQVKPDVTPGRRFMSAWERVLTRPTSTSLCVKLILYPGSCEQLYRVPLPFEYRLARLRTRRMMQDIGTGPIGTPIQSSIASSSCSDRTIRKSILHSHVILVYAMQG